MLNLNSYSALTPFNNPHHYTLCEKKSKGLIQIVSLIFLRYE